MFFFGLQVKKRREELGLNQAELARLSGISPATINDIESGKNKTTRKLIQLADALKTTPHYLTNGREQPSGGQRLVEVRDKDLISIPQFNVTAAMGPGQFPPDHAEIVQSLVARVSDLRKRCSFSSPHNLQLITGIGPSMQPTFSDGDVLLIDTGIKTVEVDAIYVFTLGNGRAGNLFIKTLQRRRDGSLLMVSHNRQGFEPEVIPMDEEIEVHGRVILVWNARQL